MLRMPADGTKPRKYIYKARKGHQRKFGKWEARYRPTSKVLLNKYAKHLRNSRVCPKTGVMAHSYEFLEYFDSHSEMTAFITETREAFTQAKKVALAKKEQPTTMSTAPACPPTSDLEPEVEEQPPSWPLAPYNCEFQYSNWSDTGEELPLAPGLVPVVLASDWLLPFRTRNRHQERQNFHHRYSAWCSNI